MLTPAELKEYQTNGFIGIHRPLFSESETVRIRELARNVYAKRPTGHDFICHSGAHLLEPELLDWARRKEILDVIEPMIGSDIGIFSVTLFHKPSQSAGVVEWHSDAEYLNAYGAFDEIHLTSVLLALSECRIESGCVEYLPGSHRQEAMRAFDVRPGEKRMFQPKSERQDLRSLADRVPIELAEGEYSLHDIHTLHGSEANHADYDRILLNFKYFPTRLRLNRESMLKNHGIDHRVYLARGQDIAGSCQA